MAYGTLNISELDMVFYIELPFLGPLLFCSFPPLN